ncbi:MAG: hypothetical protein E7355_02550 [Clostridiales bacterium]|nr:hypothetical protein [Clostridiales bacterium]
MDAKITKQRLGRMLSYDWLKIIGVIVLVIVFWWLIFTMTGTGITPSQQFTVFNHYANVTVDYGPFSQHLQDSVDNGVFSYEVIEPELIDLSTAGNQVDFICTTRFDNSQGDMILIPNITDVQQTTETTSWTYVESFFSRYRQHIVSWDEYMAEARAYLNGYFYGDYTSGELNEEKAAADFRARVKKNKDKRFRKESKLQAGIQAEYARLNKYRDEFMQFEKYLQDGVVALTEVVGRDMETGEPFIRQDTGEYAFKANYALNICPDESKMPGLKDKVNVYYEIQTENGKKKTSAQDMCVMLFSLKEMDQDFQYETTLYLNALIKTCLATTQA